MIVFALIVIAIIILILWWYSHRTSISQQPVRRVILEPEPLLDEPPDQLIRDIIARQEKTVRKYDHEHPEMLFIDEIEYVEAQQDDRNQPPTHEEFARIIRDPQNVHDTYVVNQVREISNKLDSAQIDISTIHQAIDKYLTDSQDRDDAKATLEQMITRNAKVPTLNNKTETEILAEVWERQKLPDNNPAELQRSFVNALKDSVESGSVTCSTGCANRVIDSLVLVDRDFNEPLVTVEIIKNDIFRECGKLMSENLDAAELEQKIKEIVADYKSRFTGKGIDFASIESECISAVA